MLLAQQPKVQFSVFPNFFRKLFDVIEINRQRTAWRVDSAKLSAHLVLVSGKLALQKSVVSPNIFSSSSRLKIDPDTMKWCSRSSLNPSHAIRGRTWYNWVKNLNESYKVRL